VRKPLAAVSIQLLNIQGLSFGNLNDCKDNFTPLVVREADNCGLCNTGKFKQVISLQTCLSRD